MLTSGQASSGRSDAPAPIDFSIAPAFTPSEKRLIAAWSARMRRRGTVCEFNFAHPYLSEALHIMPGSADDPWWLVHKTPAGGFAVRLWPGVATIVPSVAEALALVAGAIASRGYLDEDGGDGPAGGGASSSSSGIQGDS